mmetsp:Transcript_50343/g.146040  ORF Transcript_50343/g.146040 Transcript_50343/m.146040 type:complete len:132 (-) Transcript_50343:572-967(-)
MPVWTAKCASHSILVVQHHPLKDLATLLHSNEAPSRYASLPLLVVLGGGPSSQAIPCPRVVSGSNNGNPCTPFCINAKAVAIGTLEFSPDTEIGQYACLWVPVPSPKVERVELAANERTTIRAQCQAQGKK